MDRIQKYVKKIYLSPILANKFIEPHQLTELISNEKNGLSHKQTLSMENLDKLSEISWLVLFDP